MAGFIRREMKDDLVIVFTADHCTPVDLGDHTGDPVPVTIYSKGILTDGSEKYSETGCARGRLGRIRGSDILPICMDLANRSEKFGA
jgi:2,3-bisphosphoglycerate-independent phosphoglycerate mutase